MKQRGMLDDTRVVWGGYNRHANLSWYRTNT